MHPTTADGEGGRFRAAFLLSHNPSALQQHAAQQLFYSLQTEFYGMKHAAPVQCQLAVAAAAAPLYTAEFLYCFRSRVRLRRRCLSSPMPRIAPLNVTGFSSFAAIFTASQLKSRVFKALRRSS